MIIKDTFSIAAGHPHARNQYNYIFLTYEIKDFKQKRKTNMHEYRWRQNKRICRLYTKVPHSTQVVISNQYIKYENYSCNTMAESLSICSISMHLHILYISILKDNSFLKYAKQIFAFLCLFSNDKTSQMMILMTRTMMMMTIMIRAMMTMMMRIPFIASHICLLMIVIVT